MVNVMTEVTSPGGWWLAIPLGLAVIGVVAATLWFLRRSRGRRVLPAQRPD